MQANASHSRRHRLIAPAITASVLLGIFALCIAACTPELDFADSLDDALPPDESPISSLPTIGKVAHYELSAPRHVSFWCGKADMAKFVQWKQQLSRRDGAKSFLIYDDYASSWPPNLADYPAKLGLPKTFCEAGDKMFQASYLSSRLHLLRINVSKEVFLLECYPANDP